jgi:N-methylhydantoinase B
VATTTDTKWDGIQNSYLPPAEPVISPDLKLHTDADEVDPFLYEVLRHNLWNINDEIGTILVKVSGSPIAYTAEDFSTAIFMENGEYIYTGHRNQMISGTIDLMVRWVLEHRSDDPGIREGDMFLGNDPWVGSSHQQDVILMCPVFWEGALFCWVACALHQYDIGGSTPGGFCPDATDVYMEAVSIPPIKIVEGDQLLPDVEEFYLRHSRMRDLVALDLRAQVAGNTVAKGRILDLIGRYGANVLKGSMQKVVNDAEQIFSKRLEQLPDGIFRGRGYLEASVDGDRQSYPVALQAEKRGSRLRLGMKGTAEQAGALSSSFAAWRSAVMTAVNPILAWDLLYATGGVLRCIDFTPEPGTISCPSYPASVSNPQGGALLAGGLAVGAVARLASLDPELGTEAFATGGGSTFAIDALSGMNQWGTPFGTVLLDPMLGGTGAFTFRDGTSTGGVWWVPSSKAANVEDNEQNYPLLYLYRREWADSGGAGQFRGGNSGCSAFVAHNVDNVDHSTATNGLAFPTSEGIMGGLPASPSRVRFRANSDVQGRFSDGEVPQSIDDLAGEDQLIRPKQRGIQQGPADVYELAWGAGGGVGDPLDREPEAVAADVAQGRLTADWGRKSFGVALDEGRVDADATASLRAEIRRQRLAGETAFGGAPLHSTASTVATSKLWDLLEFAEHADGTVIASCGRCGEVLSSEEEPSYKGRTKVRVRELTEVVANTQPSQLLIEDEIVVREFSCPSCARLLATEVARTQDEFVVDIEMYGGGS